MSIPRRALLGAGIALPWTPPMSAVSPAAPARQVPGVYRLRVGGFEVTALNDGHLGIPAAAFPGADPAEAADLQRTAFLPAGQPVRTPVNAFAVNAGDRLWLIDAGTGAARGATLGHVIPALRAAGIEPSMVDAVLMTHLHIDHAAGLTLPGGTAAFPNAELLVPEAEASFWLPEAADNLPPGQRQSVPAARAAATAYRGRTTLYRPGASLASGIETLALPGHTPGHTGVMLGEGNARLFVWADVVHVAAFQFPRPGWGIGFDVDRDAATASRRRAMDMAAADRLRVAGMHLPFPGIGHVARGGEGYAFVPSSWEPIG